jgi:hypothetical protein
MRRTRRNWLIGSVVAAAVAAATTAGCYHTPVDTSDFARGPAPLRLPSPGTDGNESGCKSYEDSLTGGQVFAMYCSYCHNAPNLSERNFANFRNVASHMRVRANLTGKEYAALMVFLRRWNDVPPPSPTPEPSPKLLIFSQPMNELRPDPPAKVEPPVPANDVKLP